MFPGSSAEGRKEQMSDTQHMLKAAACLLSPAPPES